MTPFRLLPLAAALLTVCAGSHAQERSLDPVVVSASRVTQRLFDTPAAVDRVDLGWQGAQANISLAEPLLGVPGIAVRERQNFAQDFQFSIRGFGSRATFGVRGSRLLVDGIPASMPDGQGQTSTVNLAAARHVEVLRGPWAQLYGNVGGGVVLVESRAAPKSPEAAVRVAAGTEGVRQWMGEASARTGALGLQASVTGFATDGTRPHAAARRRSLDVRMDWQNEAGTSARIGLNAFSQPKGEDPLGLAQAEFARDPQAANPLALQFNTRKTVDQFQLGVQGEHRLDARDSLAATAYAGQRSLRQFLAFSGVAPTSAGGVVDLDRRYAGASLAWHRRFDTADAVPVRWSAGIDIESMRDQRLGFVNRNGEAGELRRDEANDADAAGVFGQFAAYVHPSLQLSAGARYSAVRLRIDDRYRTAASPDDSGSASFQRFSPVAGVLWHASETLNWFANAGLGFETPTFTEVAYRPVGGGLNLGLQPARSRHLETGVKLQQETRLWQATLFHSSTDGEIVPLSNQGGRTSFRNVDGVERQGLELSVAERHSAFDWRVAYTLLQARFTQAYADINGVPVAAGNRLPGTARHVLHAGADWKMRDSATLGATLHAESRVQADDINSAAAPGYAVLGLHATQAWRIGEQQVQFFARIDNLLDRRYAGSVIVNEGNRRFYEPAAGRTAMLGVRVAW